MWRRSSAPVVSPELCDALLASLSARPAAALLSTPTVHLYTNNLQPSRTTAVGDFIEATFAGYADVALPTLSAPGRLDNGEDGVHAEVDFTTGSVVAPGEVIRGYYVTDGTGAVLYWSERFADQVNISTEGDFLSLDVVFPEPNSRDAG